MPANLILGLMPDVGLVCIQEYSVTVYLPHSPLTFSQSHLVLHMLHELLLGEFGGGYAMYMYVCISISRHLHGSMWWWICVPAIWTLGSRMLTL